MKLSSTIRAILPSTLNVFHSRQAAAMAMAAGAALGLAACNTSQNAPIQAADGTVYAAPLDKAALSKHACGAPIIAYRNLIDRDVRTGFLSQSVYDRIAPQIASSAATCTAGNSGAAIASLNATKRQFGYPT
ncbi:hypothetical protein [Pseudochelatococcus contaminans]|uniref:Uncharacterized protein n=1 Tax=Pseudochelatococcus contaminans TaxID=1538103 RepID=A0A7W5Z1Q2_9HYPH|nr:hypothetical protein [Pseudochelatococcus contaminans]MBB3808239.1 hypothetical protein [Pseudochelatococcus contaminans]